MTVHPYPLYDQLVAQVDPAKSIDIDTLVTTIKKLPTAKPDGLDHCEEIMALIYHHSLVTEAASPRTLPYGAKLITASRGITFECQQLPPDLTRILDSYLTMHS